MNRDIADMRENYEKGFLTKAAVHEDAIQQFRVWFDEARQSNITEPNAMILATVDKNGIPSARTVLLKDINQDGFIFYTNYRSDKAKDIDENHHVSLVFLWKEMERQVRISGIAQKVNRSISEKYFHSRPKGSQIGAWVSPQSTIIEDRKILENKQKEIEANYSDKDQLPLPDFWGGYIVIPSTIEFWQGRPSRLHDRLRYKMENTDWKIERLAP